MSKLIEVKNLRAGYGYVEVIHNVSFSVEKGQIIAILGSNGAGKTSTLRALTGSIRPMSGEILYNGQSIVGYPTYKLASMGISMVPEGRHLFGDLSVQDNLLMGAYLLIKDQNRMKKNLETVYELFPRVKERATQTARTLSGGEQQMVAIARGMMMDPKVLILDEPSLGLMPKLVGEIFEFIKMISKMGITILIVEQNAMETLKFCDYAYVIQNGETVIEGTGKELLTNEDVKKAYLGG
ncbi:MAG: ABC transporter ATP-binding protein [Clostridiales bacterium]|nr:ABC transporter ATP-binding protein [Clostridiales bacterium]